MDDVKALTERLLDVAGRTAANEVLRAPCVWCGYSGEGYYQPGTHKPSCPWHCVGGLADRIDVWRSVALAALAAPRPSGEREAPASGERPVQSNDDEVICPACVHQFRAIPVNVQQQIAALTAQLADRDGQLQAAHDALDKLTSGVGAGYRLDRRITEALEAAQRERDENEGAFKVWRRRAEQAEAEATALREALAALRPRHSCPSCDLEDDERARIGGWNEAIAMVSALLVGQPPTGGQTT